MSKLNLNEFEGHTPGPWDYEIPEMGDDIVIDSEGALVAQVPHREDSKNAQLIAATPDLLDLLKDARRMVKELHALLERVGHEDDAYEWAVRNSGHEEMAWWNPEG